MSFLRKCYYKVPGSLTRNARSTAACCSMAGPFQQRMRRREAWTGATLQVSAWLNTAECQHQSLSSLALMVDPEGTRRLGESLRLECDREVC